LKEFIVKQEDTLKKFTDNTYPQGSFYFNALLKKKDIKVNGVKTGKDMPLRAGDRVAYYTTAAQEGKKVYAVVYEDDNILVADKESGVNSEALYNALAEKGEYYFIHRLDRNTQGLIAFAKNKETEEELLSLFKEKRVTKIYRALCAGSFSEKHGLLTAYLQKNAEGSFVKIYDQPIGEKIVTEYTVLREYDDLSLVEITLHTGKTHQIRAHLAHIGHPVLGDTKYGDKNLNEKYKRTRQCLIARSLQIRSDGVLSYLKGKIFTSEFDFSDLIGR
jgi:23S rRNA pseudouridine955/2504/2580 synthase